MDDSENLNKIERDEPKKKREKLDGNRESLKDIKNVEGANVSHKLVVTHY